MKTRDEFKEAVHHGCIHNFCLRTPTVADIVAEIYETERATAELDLELAKARIAELEKAHEAAPPLTAQEALDAFEKAALARSVATEGVPEAPAEDVPT